MAIKLISLKYDGGDQNMIDDQSNGKERLRNAKVGRASCEESHLISVFGIRKAVVGQRDSGRCHCDLHVLFFKKNPKWRISHLSRLGHQAHGDEDDGT